MLGSPNFERGLYNGTDAVNPVIRQPSAKVKQTYTFYIFLLCRIKGRSRIRILYDLIAFFVVVVVVVVVNDL